MPNHPLVNTREKSAVHSLNQSRLNRMLSKARQNYESKKFTSAIEVSNMIYKSDATNIENLFLLGSAHLNLKNHSEALFFFQQGLKVDPQCGEALSNLGNVLKELGDSQGAIQCYLKAIKLKPRFADTYNNLATVYAELGRISQAVETYKMALVNKPNLASSHSNLGVMYKVQGNLPEAKKSFLEAIRIDPENAVSWSNLGGVFKDQGDIKSAIDYYKEAIRLEPRFADAYSNLGSCLKEAGMVEDAKRAFETAIELRPDFALAHSNMGTIYFDQGNIAKAVKSFKLAIQLESNFPDAYNNLGNTLRAQNKLDEAITCFRMALRLKADHPHAFCNLGNALKDKGLIAEAQHCFASACRLLPNFSVAQNNLGAILKEQGKHRLAIAHFEEALACDPTFVEAYYNMGCSYKDLNMTEDAIRCFTAAIRARSDFADSYVCLGQCFLEVGRVRDAVVCMEKALELRPSFSAALVKCFDVKSRIADWSSHDVVREKIKSLIASEIETKKPFSFLTVEPFLALTYNFPRARDLASERSKHIVQRSVPLSEGHSFRFRAKTPTERLRIGYISSHFGNSAVSFLHTIRAHERTKYEIFCYATSPDDESSQRRLFETSSYVEHFRNVYTTNAMEIATKIHKDKIHILVDLDGHTESLVTEVMALRAAPIQIHYPMRYPGAMEASFIDYCVVDTNIIKDDKNVLSSEALITFKERTYLVSEHAHVTKNDTADEEKVEEGEKCESNRPGRSSENLPDDKVVLACFAQHHKIDPKMFDILTSVMKKCSKTILWLLKWTQEGTKNLVKELVKRGISENRVVFSDVLPREQHLKRCYLADLYIDTVSVSSVSTICDVLWSGTPAVAIRGQDLARRTAASALSSVDLSDNVCDDLASYETRILNLVQDAHSLHDMRTKLESDKKKFKLFDTTDCARTLEKAYSSVWKKYEWGESPGRVVV